MQRTRAGSDSADPKTNRAEIADAANGIREHLRSDPEVEKNPDSFYDEGALSAPSYTRPPEYRGHCVPEVLLTGDHAKIEAWREAEARRLTERHGGE